MREKLLLKNYIYKILNSEFYLNNIKHTVCILEN